MLPLIEVQGIIAILYSILVILGRMYYCNKKYKDDFIIDVLFMSIFTSFLWIVFFVCKKYTGLNYQFVVSIILYIILIYFIKKKSIKI